MEQDLKQYLNNHLPKYMIPKTITHIDCMPLTTNEGGYYAFAKPITYTTV